MGEEPGSGASALDGARGQRRLAEALALRAGQPWAHQAPDDEACRDVLELLGDVFAQAFECPAAIGAVLVGVEHRLFTGKTSSSPRTLTRCPLRSATSTTVSGPDPADNAPPITSTGTNDAPDSGDSSPCSLGSRRHVNTRLRSTS